MIALILAMGLADRLRGSGWMKYSHALGLIGMGLVSAIILQVHGWTFLYVLSTVVLCGAPGWGNPLGAAFDRRPMGTNYEWWQVGILRKSVPLALFVRGLMWGLPLVFINHMAPLAFAIPFTLAPYLFRNWDLMEFVRGLAIGIMLTVFSHA